MENYNIINEDVRIEEFTMSGFQKQPEYFDEKCFYYISLNFKNKDSEEKIPWIKVGNEKIDNNIIKTLKENLDSIVTNNSKLSNEFYYNNASVKLVFFKNTLVAIGNILETRFLLCSSIVQQPISMYRLFEYIKELYKKTQQDNINAFFKNLKSFNNYLQYNPHCLDCISDENIHTMQDIIFNLGSIVQKRVEKTYKSSTNN